MRSGTSVKLATPSRGRCKPGLDLLRCPQKEYLPLHNRCSVGTRKITISDEAYQRLVSLKRTGETLTDVINRLTAIRSVSELAGVLEPHEADRLRGIVKEIRTRSANKLKETSLKLRRD